MKKTTHKDRVLKYLKDVGSITSLDAIREFGNTRLAATIFSLKEDGYDIVSKQEVVVNRYGENRIIARYFLV